MRLRAALNLNKTKLPQVNSIRMDTPEELKFKPSGKKIKSTRTWYRGEHTNYFPRKPLMRSMDAARAHVIKGWAPAKPVISPATAITAFGSCFAAHIARWLHARNYNVASQREGTKSYLIHCSEGMVNSFAIRGQLEWALEGKVPDGEFWHGYDARAFGYDEDVRIETQAVLRSTDIFIITLGLAEVWYDKPTGEVFWRAVPADKFDHTRHAFRVTSTSENADNLRQICRLLHKHVPGARIVFTLSPIPLMATFRPVSCITASAASKAILRAAIDEVLRDNADASFVHYWPSYEIVLQLFCDPFEEDGRHVKRPILDYIMTLFESVWCTEQPSLRELKRRYQSARRSDLPLLRRVTSFFERPDVTHDWMK